MTVLIDTNLLVAAASPRDLNHAAARQALQNITGIRIVPAPVLPEMFYLLVARVNYQTAVGMYRRVRIGSFQIEPLTSADMARMEAIMLQYADNQFDYVDAAIMALAERLDIEDVYTFDQRDFRAFRPAHRPFLRLLP